MKAIIRKDEQAVSPVIATILMVAITVVLAAVLYVMVSGLLGGQTSNRPVLTFGPLQPTPGNMSFSVASVSQSFPFSSYKVTLAIGAETGPATAIVAESSYATIAVPNVGTVRVHWSDLGDEGNLNDGDSFRVTQNDAALPSGSYTFYLLWSADNAQIQTKTWLI